MVRIFTSLILLLSASLVFGQVTLTVDANPIFKAGTATDFEIVGKVVLTNTSSEDKTFTWLRDDSGFVGGWESGVCDINFCYEREVSTKSFLLAAGTTGTLDLHMYPEGICGEGFAKITVSDDSDATNFISVQYDFNSRQGTVDCIAPVGVTNFKLDFVKVYPNPANDFFTLTDVPSDLEIITVYNILGNKVKTFNAVQNANYNISDLNKGLYLINLTNRKGENLNTIKLHKN